MKKYGLLLFLILSISCFSENKKSQQLQNDIVKSKIISEENTNEIYKDRMKNFIREIRNDAGKNKYIITQNGNELYFRDGKLDRNFFPVPSVIFSFSYTQIGNHNSFPTIFFSF